MKMGNAVFLVSFITFVFILEVQSDSCNDAELENTLRQLLTPQEYPSIQLQALRKDMLRKFQEALEKADEEDDQNFKRSFSSLAAWNNLPTDKRNLEALARAGYIKTLPDKEEDGANNDANYKRSLAVLAKNGQLPTSGDEKRGIESLARNGELHQRNNKNLQDLLEELYSKRNVGSLARNFNLPSYGKKRFLGSLARTGDLNYQYKRNVAALARDGMKFSGKRNVAALLRQDNYWNSRGQSDGRTDVPETDMEKRNIASIKAQYAPKFKRATRENGGRSKREIDVYDELNGEYPSPVYQNQNINDYEELMKELTGAYPETEKRFLGSVARTGWFRPSNNRLSRFNSPEKRHIGSLARLGWLPTLRNVRRFNRSGRSASTDYECREDPAIGETENNAITEEDPFSLDDKRFLLQPAVDNILLRKLFIHPRSH